MTLRNTGMTITPASSTGTSTPATTGPPSDSSQTTVGQLSTTPNMSQHQQQQQYIHNQHLKYQQHQQQYSAVSTVQQQHSQQYVNSAHQQQPNSIQTTNSNNLSHSIGSMHKTLPNTVIDSQQPSNNPPLPSNPSATIPSSTSLPVNPSSFQQNPGSDPGQNPAIQLMGNNFSNENYTDGHGVHHPHYKNHYRNNAGSLMTPSNVNNNNSSSALDQIYEEINENNAQQKSTGHPLCDLTNLTEEERFKLDEIRNKRDTLKAEIQKLREEISNVRKELSRIDSLSTGDLTGGLSNQGFNSGSNLKGDLSENSKAKKLQIGKKKFNMDPKKGIDFLIENGVLERKPEDVAKFLFKGDGLTKLSIGTYLGEKIDFNLQVLDAFVELHNFHNLHLVKALRQFLYSFRLPGEAQKIDRIMEKFAGHYCKHNDGVFNSSDTCYVLCFSVIMLNTTLHNPNVKCKMNSDQFVNMNRGINNGDDLPQSLLVDLYESIRNEPFKMPEDDGFTFFNPDREGWLWKQGGRVKNWKRRWFLLSDKCLYYFENTNDKEPRGIIPLENIGVRDMGERCSRQHCMELYSTNQVNSVIKACKTDADGRVIEGRHTVYRLSAGTEQEKDAWLQSLKASVSKSPFYEMLAARKRKAQHN